MGDDPPVTVQGGDGHGPVFIRPPEGEAEPPEHGRTPSPTLPGGTGGDPDVEDERTG